MTDRYPPNTRITVRGLVSKPELNGTYGKILGWSADRGRYLVQMEDGVKHAVKSSNVTSADHTRNKALPSTENVGALDGAISMKLDVEALQNVGPSKDQLDYLNKLLQPQEQKLKKKPSKDFGDVPEQESLSSRSQFTKSWGGFYALQADPVRFKKVDEGVHRRDKESMAICGVMIGMGLVQPVHELDMYAFLQAGKDVPCAMAYRIEGGATTLPSGAAIRGSFSKIDPFKMMQRMTSDKMVKKWKHNEWQLSFIVETAYQLGCRWKDRKNMKKAVAAWDLASSFNITDGKVNIVMAYLHHNFRGKLHRSTTVKGGEDLSIDVCVRLLQEAFAGGDPEAYVTLSEMHIRGIGGVAMDHDLARRYLKEAAQAGSGRAQEGLGVLYANGAGVPKNEKKAVKWYKKGVQNGSSNCMFNLGRMMMRGQGCDVHVEKGLALIKRAAGTGHVKAKERVKQEESLAASAALGIMSVRLHKDIKGPNDLERGDICANPACRKVREKKNPRFARCSRCKEVAYCSTACQRVHWKKHKKQGCGTKTNARHLADAIAVTEGREDESSP
mgnify:CR=1 FL=1|jgi:hypothetical protein